MLRAGSLLLKVCQAHPAIGPVHQIKVLSCLVPIAILDRVFEELETVAKDSRLHAPVRGEVALAKEDSDLEPLPPRRARSGPLARTA